MRLPSYIYSYEQVRAYLLQVQQAEAVVLQGQVAEKDVRENILNSETLSSPLKRYMKELLDSGNLNSDSIAELKKALEEAKNSAPRFRVLLGDMPGEELKEKIANWFRDNVHASSLVSFRYDSDLAGGIVIQSRNKIFDHSFRKKIMKPEKKFSEILRLKG